MKSSDREWDCFDPQRKQDHSGRAPLLVMAIAGCGLAWAAIIAAVSALI